VVVIAGVHKRQLVVRLHGRSELALRNNGLGRSREADGSWCLVHFVSLGDGLTLGDLVGAGGWLADWRRLLLSIALFGSSAALKILQAALKLLACSGLLDGFAKEMRCLVSKTYGSCAEQCGSVFFCAQQDLRSWSSPHQGGQSC
jgi:hypothetical protein